MSEEEVVGEKCVATFGVRTFESLGMSGQYTLGVLKL